MSKRSDGSRKSRLSRARSRRPGRSRDSDQRQRAQSAARAPKPILRGRKLVGAALTHAERLAAESREPGCLVIDAHGQVIKRMVAWVGEKGADRDLVERLSAQELPTEAAALALIRVDDGMVRALGWDLAATEHAVSLPVFGRDGQVEAWRRGWLDQFDDTVRAREERRGSEQAHGGRGQARAETELSDLARLALGLLQDHVLPVFDEARKVPALIFSLDGNGYVGAAPAPVEPLRVVDTGLGEILVRLQTAQARAEKDVGCSIFRWHAIEGLAPDQEQFVLTGYDARYETIFVNLLKIEGSNDALRLASSSEVSLRQLETWLEEGVREIERKDRDTG